jgi:integrase/recombinase XerD
MSAATMAFADAVDAYIQDQRRYGRINSDNTERGYREGLVAHAEDVGDRGPYETDRDDVKRTLARWPHPNSQRRVHSVLVSFYDWQLEEGLRPDNPARQVRRAKWRATPVYRLTRAEVGRMMGACLTQRERRVVFVGLCTGARRGELAGLQGRHFEREGWTWLSADITKGKRERWVPVIGELESVAEEICSTVAAEHYIIPGGRQPDPSTPISHPTIGRIVRKVATRAGIAGHVTPHTMRHSFGDLLAKDCGLRVAQVLLGHADVSTTASTYVDRPGLEEIAASVQGFRYLDVQGNATKEARAASARLPWQDALVRAAPQSSESQWWAGRF